MINKIIEIGEVDALLKAGRTVKVLTTDNKYEKIKNFIEKGIQKTYKVLTKTGESVECSANHLFFTNSGWMKCKDIIPNLTQLLTEKNDYQVVDRVDFVGKKRIVDISVDSKDQSYFGNGILHHNSGKSLLGAHFLAETQKKGGVAVFIDTEYAVSPEFLVAIGVDIKKMLYINVNTVEDVFDNIEAIIAKVRKSEKVRPVGILVDSMAAASTKKEIASDHGADGYATGKAIAISKAMRKITELLAKQRITVVFTNQLRQKIGFIGYGDPFTTGGGKALAFHASLRLRLKSTNKITNANKEVIGIKTKATVIKNRMGPPMRSVEFDIFFDRGIDNYGNWLQNLLDWDVVTNAKKVKDANGKKKSKKELDAEKEEDKKAKNLQFIMTVEGKEPETVVFEKKDFPKLLVERPDAKEWLYQQICTHYIMKYKSADAELNDEVEYDAEDGEGMDE